MSQLDSPKNAKSIETQTIMTTTTVDIECPHCSKKQSGFWGNPAGGQFVCGDYKQTYQVHPDADIEFG